MLILAIESSCDDTSAALLHNNTVLSNVVHSQLSHAEHGGVVPELASREHLLSIEAVCREALRIAGKSLDEVDLFAATQGPGLLGSLLVGWCHGRTLAWAGGKPFIGVDHMLGHILSPMMGKEAELPMLTLVASGGHTLLVEVKSPTDYRVIGRTTDDAAGEAFDKGAKLMGLPYLGGPEIDRLSKEGASTVFSFPKPQAGGWDFSFSGLKTALLYTVQKLKKENESIEAHLADLCASYQEAIVAYLIRQWRGAAMEMKPLSLGLAGGVALNSRLREQAQALANELHIPIQIAAREYCTDNAAMIGHAAWHLHGAGHTTALAATPYARMPT